MKKFSKIETGNKIKELFKDEKDKSQKEIKKIKKLAMSYNLPLKEKRKLFCKKCLTPYSYQEKIRIKKKIKKIICKNCGYENRWKIKD